MSSENNASSPPASTTVRSLWEAITRHRWVRQARRQLDRHGAKLWWLHTSYALGLGISVVIFARKGFSHARWLTVSLSAAWLLTLLLFRLFGTGAAQQAFTTAYPNKRLRFLVMTYVLKNLYQGMLFFLLPFYWKSCTWDAPNVAFVAILGVGAILSTLDIVFDRVLMRWKAVATAFYGLTLFCCWNLVIPALLPDTRTVYTLASAAAITVIAFWTFHIPLEALRRKRNVALLAASVIAGVIGSYYGRTFVPAVPMYLSHGAVGDQVLADGRIALEAQTLHSSALTQLLAVTDVVAPGGKGDRLQHVWRIHGQEVCRIREDLSRVSGPEGTIRLHSGLRGATLPPTVAGPWSVDIETEDHQLVGRVRFTVVD